MSATVFVRNLPFDVTQDALEKAFGEIGPVKKVDVIKDKGKKKSESTTRGFAFVRFAMAADAQYAIEKLNGSDFNGRAMRLELAKEKGQRNKGDANKQPKAEAVSEAPVAEETTQPEEVEEEEPKKEKAKKDKKQKKKKQEEEEQVEEVKEKKKDKKKDKKETEVEEVAYEELAPVEEPAHDEQENVDGHVQSERNARRRMHREFLRQVEARKEASASAEEKSVLVYGLGQEVTQKALFKKVKKIAPVNKVELKEEPKTNKKFAVVEFSKLKDVELAVQKLDSHIFKGATLKAVRMADASKAAKDGEGLRLIVRNLSFQATDADLEKLFGECGAISEARVVRLALEDPDNAPEGAVGKSRGFAFVQFRDIADARKAIDKLNGYKLKGREMIVDFALSKAKYLQQQKQVETQPEENEEEQNNEQNDGEEDEDESNEDIDHGSVEMEEEDDDEGDDEDVDMSDAEEEDDDESDDEDTPTAYKEDSDEQRSRTVFIRNLSFQTTEESMKEFFSTFGAVEYARIVMDKGSGLSKGVGFVRFKHVDAAETVLARGQIGTDHQQKDKKKHLKNKKKQQENLFTLSALADGDALMLDGRMLIVSRAVAKDDATRLAEANSADRKKKDKRNMYLAYEGTINVNKISEEELELPKMDIEKRRRAIKEKKEKLKNPLYFVSPTRLSVRNIGVAVDDKQLKKIFHDAAVTGVKQNKVTLKELKVDFLPPHGVALDKVPVKVKMAKIVRDMENQKPGKEPRSRGFGFVEFEEHVHALAALRVLNNNPQYTAHAAGPKLKKGGKALAENEKSRLIVEFALENHGKLKLREKKQQDAVKRREEERALKEAQGDDKESKEEKKSRGQRQREKKKLGEQAPKEEKKEKKEKPQQPVKKAVVAAPMDRQQKKRKREDDDLEKALPIGSAKEKKQLSRKQRKNAKEHQEEQSFEALVRNYKKEIFGEKPRKGGEAASSADAGASEAVSSRWFD